MKKHEDREEGFQGIGVHRRVLHLAKMINDSGQMSAYCSDPPRPIDMETEATIQSSRFHDDVSCPKCRQMAGLGEPKISRMYLLLQMVAMQMDIERLFWDAIEWNSSHPDEPPMNPDPDGVMASNWLMLRAQFIAEIDKMKAFMEKHDGRFGWPEELREGK